jgi:hypothetical protein
MLASLACWRWASSARASPRAWCPVRRSSARARWPVLLSALPAPPLPSVPPRRAWVAPSWPGRAWPRRRQAGRQRCACRHVGGQQRQVGVPGRFRRRWRRPRARRLAWAMSPRPAHRPQAQRCIEASAAGQKRPLRRAGWNGAAPKPLRGPARAWHSRCTASAPPRSNPPGPSACTAASNSPMPRPPPPTRCAVATAAAPAKARACAIPIPDTSRRTHAIQTTAGALCRHAAACHPVPSCRAGVGRAHRLARVQAKNWRLMAFGCLCWRC